jgi:branched-subunit amino acid ABC-type transport system permease component
LNGGYQLAFFLGALCAGVAACLIVWIPKEQHHG